MNKGLWRTEAASCELSKQLESWPHAEVMRDVLLVELEREEHTSGMGDEWRSVLGRFIPHRLIHDFRALQLITHPLQLCTSVHFRWCSVLSLLVLCILDVQTRVHRKIPLIRLKILTQFDSFSSKG